MDKSRILTLTVFALCLGSIADALEFSYVGCVDNPERGLVLPNSKKLFLQHAATPELCARVCLYNDVKPGLTYSLANKEQYFCECSSEPPAQEDLGSSLCSDCGYSPTFPFCDAEVSTHRGEAVYSTLVTENYNTEITIGGKGKKDVAVSFYGPSPVVVNCSTIPDAPFITQNAIALRDKDGRPMVCGGTKNPNQKSCTIYDVATNTWIPGPSMKRKRVGASVTCLENGICWVFGGKSREITEYYDPVTHTFKLGPPMPVNSVHGLCTAQSLITGKVYMAARRDPGKIRAFEFDPVTETFDEIDTLDGYDLRYFACDVVGDPSSRGGDHFLLIGGGPNNNAGTNFAVVHYAGPGGSGWANVDDYPHDMMGANAHFIPSIGSVVVSGGVIPEGEELGVAYFYKVDDQSWTPYFADEPSLARSFAPSIMVESSQCPAVSC